MKLLQGAASNETALPACSSAFTNSWSGKIKPWISSQWLFKIITALTILHVVSLHSCSAVSLCGKQICLISETLPKAAVVPGPKFQTQAAPVDLQHRA